jgi:hypothetical protein
LPLLGAFFGDSVRDLKEADGGDQAHDADRCAG